jgi:NarL family two-component system response regulator LiaR
MVQGKISVLIADDHTVVRKGLTALLSAGKYGIDVVGEACNGEEAVQKALHLKPDVILMDLIMPIKGGIEAISEIKQLQPKARILVLTSFADDENVSDAIESGAYGFLLKDTSPDELVKTIHAVYSDKLVIPQEFTKALLRKKNTENHSLTLDHDLTPRELDVLKLIAEGLSNKDIAKALFISTTTVRSHVSSMIRKLDLQNRTQLAMYARDHDLL